MRACLATLLALLLFSPAARANTIDFTQLNIAATTSWSSGDGVTISGDSAALVASLTGRGLGVGDGFIDGIDSSVTSLREGSLSIHVDGRIQSITVQPFETIDGVRSTEWFEFGLATHIPNFIGTNYYYQASGPMAPMTLSFDTHGPEFDPDALERIGLFSDFGQIGHVVYLMDHPDAVFNFGFSITALDYTPTVPTPEPASLLLFGVGVGLCLLVRRSRTEPSSGKIQLTSV
jgi:PEP-CTERM motif